VVQTPNMVNRIKGVFNTEIDEALKTQKEMPRFRFVIPVHTVEHCLMPQVEREKFHTIPVRTPENIGALAVTILQDWKERANLRLVAAGAK